MIPRECERAISNHSLQFVFTLFSIDRKPLPLDSLAPLSAIGKKHSPNQEVLMTAEVSKFPHDQKYVILSLMKTAKRLEKTSANQCIRVQRDIINLLVLECNRSNLEARAVFKVLRSLTDE